MMTLSELARTLDATLTGPDARFSGVGTDTRALAAGDLFVALIGPNHDGHAFLHEAQAAGAAGALVSRAVDTPLPCVRVADTRLALGRLAAHWRTRFDIPLIAVTGSNGKTTVKEMLAAILARRGAVCATRGNFNNDIGMPLTLLRLRAGDRQAVIEMGMNHKGEIDYLTRLARPTVAVITNAGEAHLAGLGTVADVARAKGEIFAGLAADGVAVINADDAHAGLWRELAAPRRVVTFGIDRDAEVRGEYAAGTLRIATPAGSLLVQLPLLGRHNALNALAATAAALAAGATLADVKAGLEAVKPVAGRLEIKRGVNGARVIDDTYNANPASLAASLAVLRDFGPRRVAALGDMGELGPEAERLHARAGELAAKLGLERLYAVGELTRFAVERFGEGGRHFPSVEALIERLRAEMDARTTVLVKGSRAARMERVVAGIVQDTTAAVAATGEV
jgi:UDP-N-acetylmuramoyl-tripeptide--D-alanyl-D-alanine ligase